MVPEVPTAWCQSTWRNGSRIGSSSRRAEQARFAEALLGDHAAGKERLAAADAAHVQALEPQGIVTLADDQLRAAAADVHDQAPAGLRGQAVRRAQVDQARLLDAGNDLDGVAERAAGPRQEGIAAARAPQGIGADSPHLAGLERGEALAEAAQAGERELGRLGEIRPFSSRPAPSRTISRMRSRIVISPFWRRATTMWKLFEPRSTAAMTSGWLSAVIGARLSESA
jgi:hypothetical protein